MGEITPDPSLTPVAESEAGRLLLYMPRVKQDKPRTVLPSILQISEQEKILTQDTASAAHKGKQCQLGQNKT